MLLCVAGAPHLTLRTIYSFCSYDFHLQLAGLLDGDSLGGLAGLGSDTLDSLDDVKTLDNLSENDVLAIEPRGLDGADEELRAVAALLLVMTRNVSAVYVRSGTSVGHGEDTGASVL
jgi:hypothetical protein